MENGISPFLTAQGMYAGSISQDLYEACITGELARVREIITNMSNNDINVDLNWHYYINGNPEHKDSSGNTPLIEASNRGYSEIVDLLIQSGSRVDEANRYGDLPIHACCFHGHHAILNLLLWNKSYVNAVNNEGNTPLHIAAMNDQLQICNILLDNAAQIHMQNNNGDTPLSLAAWKGHNEIVLALSERCSEITINVANQQGETAFSLAAYGGHLVTLNILSWKNAAMDTCNVNGLRPLHWACLSKQIEIVEFLISLKIDLHAKTNDGDTALHLAVSAGDNVEVIKILLNAGADPSRMNNEGKTPLVLCQETGQQNLCNLLQSYSVDNNEPSILNRISSDLSIQGIDINKITKNKEQNNYIDHSLQQQEILTDDIKKEDAGFADFFTGINLSGFEFPSFAGGHNINLDNQNNKNNDVKMIQSNKLPPVPEKKGQNKKPFFDGFSNFNSNPGSRNESPILYNKNNRNDNNKADGDELKTLKDRVIEQGQLIEQLLENHQEYEEKIDKLKRQLVVLRNDNLELHDINTKIKGMNKKLEEELEKQEKKTGELIPFRLEALKLREDLLKKESERECAICFTNVVNRVLGPCGHCLCGECTDSLQRQGAQMLCPFCRRPVDSIMPFFV